MKKIELVIEPHKLGDVHHALTAIGVSGATVRAGAASETRLEIVVSPERAADVIRAFAGAGWRGLIGDGKMVVYEVAEPRENLR
jgi:nitrogen regulatory protein PII